MYSTQMIAAVVLVHIMAGVHVYAVPNPNLISNIYVDMVPIQATPQAANANGQTFTNVTGCVVIDNYILVNCTATPNLAHIYFIPQAVDVYYANGNVDNILKIEAGCDTLWHPCNYSFTIDLSQVAPGRSRIIYRWLAPQNMVMAAIAPGSNWTIDPTKPVTQPATQVQAFFDACAPPTTAGQCIAATNFVAGVGYEAANISTIPANTAMWSGDVDSSLNWVNAKLACAGVTVTANLSLTNSDFLIQEMTAAFPLGTPNSEACPGNILYAHRTLSTLHDNPPSMLTFTVPAPFNDRGIRTVPVTPAATQCTAAGAKACAIKALQNSIFNSDQCAPLKGVSACYTANKCTYPLQDLCSSDKARKCGSCYN